MKKQNNAKAGRRGLIILLILVLAVIAVVFGCSHRDAADTEQATSETTVQTTEATTQADQPMYTFRYDDRLRDHYRKHGIEMGFSSAEEYLAAANAVISNPNALVKTEKEDGDYVYYVEDTNEFVVLSRDGYIRTYFCPDGGRSYFDRQ